MCFSLQDIDVTEADSLKEVTFTFNHKFDNIFQLKNKKKYAKHTFHSLDFCSILA